ncbi:MAG: uracil-DNA glycosylase [Betaproteobacteria bacterium]|nr:uracil-DNA glycosylase [Betaproteobacteria bacterium]
MVDLATIAEDIRACTRCVLHEGRHLAVPGEGPAGARLMFVGEAPGRQEDVQGRPFCGAAGKVFDQLLHDAGIARDQTFITSVVKCRPPHNRLPHQPEIAACAGAHLTRQIAVIAPAVICLLGALATRTLLGETRLGDVRGRFVRRDRLYFPTFHPAAAARNPAWRRTLTADLRTLSEMLARHPCAR